MLEARLGVVGVFETIAQEQIRLAACQALPQAVGSPHRLRRAA
ncbi:MAG: hypothetical protein PHO08_04825 [Methylococcales bacterium]|nr:hypothetical protein [Methylococcales bacterium]